MAFMLSLLLLLCSSLPSALPLILLFTNGTSLILPSVYSTLGTPNTTTVQKSPHISILSSQDVNNHECSIYKNVTGHFVVFKEFSMPGMEGCNTDTSFGGETALARTVQKYGGLVLVLEKDEKYKEGRIRGFSKSVHMPVIIVNSDVMTFLVTNNHSIQSLELPPISPKEKKSLDGVVSSYYNVVLVYMVVYGFLMFMLALTLVVDSVRIFKSRKEKPHIMFLKIGGLATSICTYTWLMVDPFGFKGIFWWKTCVLYYIQQGLYTAICLLVLLLLLYSLQSSKIVKNPRRIAIVIYSVIAAEMVLSIVQGIYCSHSGLLLVSASIYISAIFAISVGYFFFAKEVITTFRKSQNKAKFAATLPVKVAAFSLTYIIVQYVVIVLALLQPLGHIISVLVATILGPFMFFIMLMILFFPSKFLFVCLGLNRFKTRVAIPVSSSSKEIVLDSVLRHESV